MSQPQDDLVNCHCSTCQAKFLEIANSWIKVTKSHVTTYEPSGTIGFSIDKATNIRIGDVDFDGNSELKECTLRLLVCNNCERTLGVKCTEAPESKLKYK
jgi:hypothetical protein